MTQNAVAVDGGGTTLTSPEPGAEVPTGFRELDRATRLLLVRRGTARLAHLVAVIPNADLDRPSLLPGWRRRDVVAHVAHEAAELSRLSREVAAGAPIPTYASKQDRAEAVRRACTLGDDALRNLFTHTIARLGKAWDEMSDRAWEAPMRDARGELVPCSESLWMRARDVWVHAVDLDSGAVYSQMPADVQTELLADAERAWRQQGLDVVVEIVASRDAHVRRVGDSIVVSGSLPVVVRWATGRSGPVASSLDDDVVRPLAWQ